MSVSGDPFTNARPYFDVTFPSSGDPFSIAGFRNSLSGLGFMDMIPLQPRAHNPADKKVMVRGRDASNFYNPVYYGDANQRIPFASGDSPQMNAPVSNPRIDIVYLTPSGDIKVQTGTEAAAPTLPTLSPSGDSRFPICAVWHKTTMTKIVNFEDKDSNSGDSYIYQDLRPWMRTAGAGSVSLSNTVPLNPSGSNTAGVATQGARQDHTHQGVHSVKVPGSGDNFGDVEMAIGQGLRVMCAGTRLTITGKVIQKWVARNNFYFTGTSVIPDDTSVPQISEGVLVFKFVARHRSTSNRLRFKGIVHCGVTASVPIFYSLFQDGGASAVSAGFGPYMGANEKTGVAIDIDIAVPNNNDVTWQLNVGPGSAATIHFNGDPAAAASRFGGTVLESMLEVEEYEPGY